MTLPELVDQLRTRNIGDANLYNELNKIYGVSVMPQRQDAARQEAIKRLQEDDKNKPSLKKGIVIIAGVVGFLAAIATIIGLIIAL